MDGIHVRNNGSTPPMVIVSSAHDPSGLGFIPPLAKHRSSSTNGGGKAPITPKDYIWFDRDGRPTSPPARDNEDDIDIRKVGGSLSTFSSALFRKFLDS